MNGLRFPWVLFLALLLLLAGPIALGMVRGNWGDVLLVLAWGLAVGAFTFYVRGLPHRSGVRSDRRDPPGPR